MAATKLGIGTATTGLMEARTAFSLLVATWCVQVEMQPFLGIGCYIHNNRNMLVDSALAENCSHLFFLDTDLMFPPDGIVRLLNHNLDIVGGRYNKRTLNAQGKPEPTVRQQITQLSEVPFVPSGFLLVNTDVFRTIGKPYFSFDERSDSDDLYFCNKALDAGFKVYCEPTIQIGHLGTAVF